MAEINFVTIKTENTRKGNKKLTKSLFKQVIEEQPEKKNVSSILGWVNYSTCHIHQTLLNITKNGMPHTINIIYLNKEKQLRRGFLNQDNSIFEKAFKKGQLFLDGIF